MIFFVRKSLLVYILVLIQQSCWASEIMKTYFFCCVFVLSLASFSFLACLLRLSIHFIFSDNVHCTYFVLILQCMKVQNKLTESNRNKLRSNCFQMWTLYRLCYTSTKYCYYFLPFALYECMNLAPGRYFLLNKPVPSLYSSKSLKIPKG